jgi:hypothetical protein
MPAGYGNTNNIMGRVIRRQFCVTIHTSSISLLSTSVSCTAIIGEEEAQRGIKMAIGNCSTLRVNMFPKEN